MATISSTGAPRAPMNLFARFVGVVISPKATFESVAEHPKALGMLVLICVLSATLFAAFFSTQAGKDAWLDAATSGPMAPRDMTDEQYAAMERMAGFAGPLAIAQALIVTPIMMAVVAAILWAVFNAALGGNATFKQIFAVVVHAWVIIAVSQLFTLPLSYASGTLQSATNLAVLLPMIEETSFMGRLLGVLDFFLGWALIVLAIGLAVLFRRRTQPIAMTLLGLYLGVALLIAVIRS